jgi:hypothetical protein
MAEAQMKVIQLARGDVDTAQLRGTDRLLYGRAVELLSGLGINLDLAVAGYVEARKDLKSVPLKSAVDFEPVTVRQAVDQFLAHRSSIGIRQRTLGDDRARLNRFAEAFQCSLS